MSDDTITLVPTFIIYLNDVRIPAELEASIKKISITDSMDSISSSIIEVADPERYWIDNKEIFPGSSLKLLLGYKDEVQELFYGEITALNPKFSTEGLSLSIKSLSCLHRLSRIRHTRSYNDKTADEIADQICREYQLQLEADSVPYPHPFTVQKSMSDFDLLYKLALRSGCHIWCSGKTVYFSRNSDTAENQVVLEWGKTLTSLHGGRNTDNLKTAYSVYGRSRIGGEFITGKAGTDSIKDKIGGNKSGNDIARDVFGDTEEIINDYLIIEAKDAENLALSELQKNSMEFIKFTGSCEGNAYIKAGNILKIEALGDRFSGEYFVNMARHELVPFKGYTTFFDIKRNAVN